MIVMITSLLWKSIGVAVYTCVIRHYKCRTSFESGTAVIHFFCRTTFLRPQSTLQLVVPCWWSEEESYSTLLSLDSFPVLKMSQNCFGGRGSAGRKLGKPGKSSLKVAWGGTSGRTMGGEEGKGKTGEEKSWISRALQFWQLESSANRDST